MNLLYDKRCVIKVVDGDIETSKYIILVRRHVELIPTKDKEWCPLTKDTGNNGVIMSPSRFLLTMKEAQEMLDSGHFNLSTVHGRTKFIEQYGKDSGFSKWIMEGFKNAMTIDEHLHAGNELKVTWYYSQRSPHDLYIKSNRALVEVDEGLQGPSPLFITITFAETNLKPKVKEVIKEDFYIIKITVLDGYSLLFKKLGSMKLFTATSKYDVMRFPSEIAVLDYCNKYQKRFGQDSYDILHIKNEEHLDQVIYNSGKPLIY